MITKLAEIFAIFAEELEDLSTKDSLSYEFEASFNILIHEFGHSVLQSIVEDIPKSKNDRVTILDKPGLCMFSQKAPTGNNLW